MELEWENWEYYFRSVILDRGVDYYETGRVREVVRNGNHFSALVEGTEDYLVEFDFKDDRINHLYCDCPYAQKGYYCKHEAAVLYSLDDPGSVLEDLFEEEALRDIKILANFREKISKFSKEELIELLLEEAQRHKDLALRYNTLPQTREEPSFRERYEDYKRRAKILFETFARIIDIECDLKNGDDAAENSLEEIEERSYQVLEEIKTFSKELLTDDIFSNLKEAFPLTLELLEIQDGTIFQNYDLCTVFTDTVFEYWIKRLKQLTHEELKDLKNIFNSIDEEDYDDNARDFLDLAGEYTHFISFGE